MIDAKCGTIRPLLCLICTLAFLIGGSMVAHGDGLKFYVSADGNDAWSGKQPRPRDGDGPFATLEGARDALRAVKKAEGLLVSIEGEDHRLTGEDVVVEQVWPENLVGTDETAFGLALNTELTDELVAEGMARDIVRHVQQLRKDADLEMDARIRLRFDTDDEAVAAAVDTWAGYIKSETLALDVARGLLDEPDRVAKVGGSEIRLAIAEA